MSTVEQVLLQVAVLISFSQATTLSYCESTGCTLSHRFRRTLIFVLILLSQCSALEDLPENIDDPRIGSEKGALHVVTSTECGSNYLVYQAWAQKYTFDLVQQPGKYTRILSCNEPEEVAKEDLEMMDTLVVPSWTAYINDGDHYPPYNKPIGIIHWLAKRKPTAEWTLIVDPDMLFRQPFLVKNFEVPEGLAVSAEYNYLVGVQNELAEKHLPDVKPRDDTFGGPRGRRADMSGAYYFLRTRDLIKLAPLWFKYTKDVRLDPTSWKYVGEVIDRPEERPWIAEMYGYCYAAASMGLWHRIETTVQYYPNYEAWEIPLLVHYGLNNTLPDYWFDKHTHLAFDPMKCPPWNMDFNRGQEDDGGLFPHPPLPSTLPDVPPRERFGKLMVIEVVNTLNQALCKRHKTNCRESEQLQNECEKVNAISKELTKEYEYLYYNNLLCHDNTIDCKNWAEEDQCEENWLFMINYCRTSCKRCRTYIPIRPFFEDSNRQTTTEGEEKKEEGPEKETETTTEETLIAKDETESKTTNEEEAEAKEKNKTFDEADIVATKTFENTQTQSVDKSNIEEEIVRCNSLDKASFYIDTNCLRLAEQGFQRLKELQDLTPNQDKDQLVHTPSNINLYRLLAVAVVLVIAITVIKRRFPFLLPRSGNTKDL